VIREASLGRIPEATIEAIRTRIDVVDLVGRYVSLRQTGRSFKGLCPFHHEKTPSFHVHPERQIFHCFGCGAGGNAFAFLMKHENLSFPEAARVLAAQCGIEIPESDDGAETGLLRRLREATAAAQSHYRAELVGAAGAGARAYLERRGIDLATAQRFGIGFAPESWDALARALADKRVPAELAERAGLLSERKSGGHYDRLRGRVTFPIQDVRGDVVAFGGRALSADQEPKYLNTPESPLFRKREAFYGLPDALEAIRRSGRAIVVEGYFDRIALARAGVGEALATCGTALTPEHARQLRRRTREVVLLFDGDEAGQRAMERSLAILLPEGLRVRAAALPAQDDPDSLLQREGADALRGVVDAAQPALEAVIQRAAARSHATPWEKSDAVAQVVPLLALVADPIERSEHERQLALAVGVEADAVYALVRREHAQRRGVAADRDAAASEPAPGPRATLAGDRESRWAQDLVRQWLDHPALARELDAETLALLFPSPPWSRLLPALVELVDAEGSAEVEALAALLDAESAATLRAIAVHDGEPLGIDRARALQVQMLDRLRQRRRRETSREHTRRFLTGEIDAAELLAQKQRRLEERKSQGLAASPARSD
jgi:DNA primase